MLWPSKNNEFFKSSLLGKRIFKLNEIAIKKIGNFCFIIWKNDRIFLCITPAADNWVNDFIIFKKDRPGFILGRYLPIQMMRIIFCHRKIFHLERRSTHLNAKPGSYPTWSLWNKAIPRPFRTFRTTKCQILTPPKSNKLSNKIDFRPIPWICLKFYSLKKMTFSKIDQKAQELLNILD